MRSLKMSPLLLLACGPAAAPAPAEPTAVQVVTPAPSAPVAGPAAPVAAPDLLARLTPDLARCYASGKAATPTMADGRVTLNGSVTPSGAVGCAIPSEATGLTQDVVDCMSDRLAAEAMGPGVARTIAVPVVVKDGAIGRGTVAATTILESVETTRMPDAFDVLDAIVPGIQECVRGSGVKSLLLGAKIGADGRTQCLLTRPSEGVPRALVDCATNVFQKEKFPVPKRSSAQAAASGIVLVPITVSGGR